MTSVSAGAGVHVVSEVRARNAQHARNPGIRQEWEWLAAVPLECRMKKKSMAGADVLL